jgi:competence protein ComEC
LSIYMGNPYCFIRRTNSTLPLSIYYFHQFPGLFFITNLAIIPLLSVLMILGVLVMVLAAFNFVPLFLSKPLEWESTAQ